MLLQLAVGPVCIFIFQTAVSSGMAPAILGVVGVTLIDGLFILGAIQGLGHLLSKNAVSKKWIRAFGAGVLMVFGLSILVGSFGYTLIPSLSFSGVENVHNVFVATLLLTLSNPLTIVFWTGVFSTQLIDEKMSKKNMYVFGTGAVLSTAVFLSGVSVLGVLAGVFVTPGVIEVMNGIVGLGLIGFGLKGFIKMRSAQ